jgi:shikimate 5-dehydrogenase
MLAAARAAGFRTIDGLEMFVRQAGLQFRAWTGQDPPEALFDRVARGALFGHNPG